jgi:hypothetical protein
VHDGSILEVERPAALALECFVESLARCSNHLQRRFRFGEHHLEGQLHSRGPAKYGSQCFVPRDNFLHRRMQALRVSEVL